VFVKRSEGLEISLLIEIIDLNEIVSEELPKAKK
jgi:hypothetical protein